MRGYKLLVLFLIGVPTALFYLPAFSQPNPLYKSIDSYAIKVKDTNLTALTRKLIKPFTADSAKVRSIFRWMTAYIGYDVKQYHNVGSGYPELINFQRDSDPLVYEREYNTAVAGMVFKKRLGICDGYSRLFKEMCTIAGVECNIVTGGSRDLNDRIGGYNLADGHAWNVVKINSQWQLVDVTWSSGYSDNLVTKFTRQFDENYYLAPPQRFAYNHFPADKKWYLFDERMPLKQPSPAPYRFPELWNTKVNAYSPDKGVIFVKKKGAIEFNLTANDSLQEVYFSDEGDEIHFSIQTLPREVKQEPKKKAIPVAASKAKLYNKKVTPDPYIDAILAFVETGDTSTNQPGTPYVPDSVETKKLEMAPAYKIDGKNVVVHYPINGSVATTLFVSYNDEYILKYELMIVQE